MALNNSQLSVRGKPTFNNVHGNQVNHNYTTTVYGDDPKVTERTMFEEFDYVKLGHVIVMKKLGSVDLSKWDWYWQIGKGVRRRARKTFSTIQVHPNQLSKFTAITYEGEDAQEDWEKDFEQFSRVSRTGSFQIFGINRSDIPMLIFHHELIPLAHFLTDSLWMKIYLWYLAKNKECSHQCLWLDTTNGVLCKGPTGPDISIYFIYTHKSVIQALPATVDMLDEGSSIAFFSKFGSNVDNTVVEYVRRLGKKTYLDGLFPTTQNHHKDNNHLQLMTNYPYLKCLWQNPPHHLPIDIIGGLRFDTVYSPLLEPVARLPPGVPGLWKWRRRVNGLVEETWVDGGLTCFKLDGHEKEVFFEIEFDWDIFTLSWLSQSSCVFDFLETTGHQENFFVINPPWELKLQSIRRKYDTYNEYLAFSDAVEETRPIYLFLYPPPMSISELIPWLGGHTHFWSFDEHGRSRIPQKERKEWGIPIVTAIHPCPKLFSWPTHFYTALRQWQIARGFNPSTADWARECGYPELEIIGAKESRWSWTWSAFAGSDISACPC